MIELVQDAGEQLWLETKMMYNAEEADSHESTKTKRQLYLCEVKLKIVNAYNCYI